ncbi:MAG: response regulator [Alphaproteobacteria bacterium]|nr:response regulator [Alphaproteobacteria bacterium]
MAAAPERSVTILMIEDDHGHARLIEKNIRRAGISNDIISFRTGRTALDWLLQGGLDKGTGLVMLDLNLPDMSGIDILARIKSDENLRRLPVVVLTTTDDQREIRRCYDLGCNIYVTKPVDYENFAATIRKLGLFLEVIELPPPGARNCHPT